MILSRVDTSLRVFCDFTFILSAVEDSSLRGGKTMLAFFDLAVRKLVPLRMGWLLTAFYIDPGKVTGTSEFLSKVCSFFALLAPSADLLVLRYSMGSLSADLVLSFAAEMLAAKLISFLVDIS